MLKKSSNLWNRVKKTEDGCWLWQGPLDKDGYGRFSIKKNVRVRAHRAAWIEIHGAIPPNTCVCHRCDTPSCINPEHLWLGSHEENMRDMRTKKRARGRVGRGEDNGFSKLSASQVREIVRRRAEGATHREICEEFGVSDGTVHNILSGKTWTSVTAIVPVATRATCLVCEATSDATDAEATGWQRGPCTCGECPTGAVWLCPEHRVESDAQEAA